MKKIGGVNSIVKIDVNAFGKRKFNKGRLVKTKWVIVEVNKL